MYDKTPKCDICMPQIMDDNIDVINVYVRVQGQHIMGMSGPVDLNLVALRIVIDTLDVGNKEYVFDRVHNLYNLILSRRRKEEEMKGKVEN